MATSQTMWVLQWDRYTERAKNQDAVPEFWVEYHKIVLPEDGQITEAQIMQLKVLMAQFKLTL